ncbi:Yip1 family protein [Ectobacillus funiculus]|uniref:Yip1 family protein n=1 Tax=Ectobacillus funiculus TaxID=137993 RepID=UPI00101B9470|nr:Yip1 family protein [Ectobacillus funiculus]
MEPNVTATNVELEKPSLWGVITSPSLQFERMKQKAPIGLPMLLMAVLYGVIGALSAYFVASSPEIAGQMPADMPEEAQFFTSAIFVAIMGGAGALIGIPLLFLITALFYKICMMIMGNDTSYKKLLSLSIYTSVIGVLGGFLNALLMAIFGGLDVQYTSLAPLFEAGTMLHSIGSAFEVFSIWGLVVTAIALQKTAGLRKGQAITLVVIFFAISLGFSILGGVLGNASFAP